MLLLKSSTSFNLRGTAVKSLELSGIKVLLYHDYHIIPTFLEFESDLSEGVISYSLIYFILSGVGNGSPVQYLLPGKSHG